MDDVRALTRDDAVTIYVEHYFTRPRIGDLPEPLWATVFDMYVNAGANAVRILQRLLNEMGAGCDRGRRDRAANDLPPRIGLSTWPRTIWSMLTGIARRDYYYRIADQRPASRKFRTPARWRQRRLDHTGRRIHQPALPPDRRAAPRAHRGMGMIRSLFGALFGSAGGARALSDGVTKGRRSVPPQCHPRDGIGP